MGNAIPIEQSSREARELAALDALAWGFPRPIYQYEVDDGAWFRLGPSVVFWYEPGHLVSEYAIHIAVAPDHRFRWPARTFVKVYEDIARQFGASRLRFIPVNEDGHVRSILERLGWQTDESGLVKDLVV